ncbi:hypothetical protein F5Y04DRAFT_173998 [Hypomontagnella monticulosa]|nr:hypothetical protein F5Y04DRAFT_173998 [Hypomontagnella monticulosa]
MSNRQSCDRCRQQKARCTRVDSSHDNADPYLPCERCTKAGALCLYSPKQKSGRPAAPSLAHNHTNSHHASLRLLRCPHESPVISSIGRQGPARRQTQGLDISVPNNGLGCNVFHHPHMPNQTETGLSPLNTDDISGWEEAHLIPGPSVPTVQGLQDSHQQMSPEQDMASQSSGAASSYEDGSPEAWTARLASLATWTTQTAKNLSPSNISTPLTVSSPQVDQVFDGTNTLLHILDSISGVLYAASSPPSSPESASEAVASKLTRDPGLIFLVLACHQRLLDSFKAICNSIRQSLHSMEPIRAEQRGTMPWKRTLHGDEGLPCVAQFVMVLQLVSHLLNQLDRALNPTPIVSGQEPSSSFDISVSTGPDVSSSWTRSPGSLSSNQGDGALLLFDQEVDVGKEPDNKQGFMELAKGFLTTVPDQHTSLNNKIRELQDSMNHFSRL